MAAPDASAPAGAAALLRSADFARAYTLTVFAAMFGSHLIERLAGRVTLVTIVTALCLLGVSILLSRRGEISLVRLVPSSLLLLCAWAFASIFWSTDAGTSLLRWLAMIGVALLAVTIGHIRDTLQTVRALGDVLRAALVLSLVLEILSGILLDTPLRFLGIQGNLAAWGPIQGIFGTRNSLGIVAVVALITFAVELRTLSVRPAVGIGSIVLAAGLALLSASPTVLVLSTGVGVAGGALALVRAAPIARRSALQWMLAGAVTASAIALYAQRSAIITTTGAADDLALRTDLWTLAQYYIRLKPVQGWGWFGAWPAAEPPFATINILLEEAHRSALNAYVDVLLQLGWAGALLLCIVGGAALVRSWLDASQRRSTVYAWTPLVLVALAVTSLFESYVLTGAGWLLLALAAVRAGQSRSWRRRLDAAGPGEAGLQHAPG
ncbi:O-antigen ligase family protein [Microbacterium sp.]|uniref:O-antigen ligase family protein n=1 Tax=Microbacterium sp. TaxID=51671 RepID=UPI0025E3B96F|nr:O-antigen ligase family protein [Microbacterium sp.]